MSDHPTPIPAGQDAEQWPPDFIDPAGTYLFIEITKGRSGGLIRPHPNDHFDIAFPNVTFDQAQQLWNAARRLGIIQEPSERFKNRARTFPYIRRLHRYYVRIWRTEGRSARHEECARQTDGIPEGTSRKRLLRAGVRWEDLTELWDEQLQRWDKTQPNLSQ